MYEKKELNFDSFNEEFDLNNPPIDIPNEVADHIDNDFDLPYSPPDLSAQWEFARWCKVPYAEALEDQHTTD